MCPYSLSELLYLRKRFSPEPFPDIASYIASPFYQTFILGRRDLPPPPWN